MSFKGMNFQTVGDLTFPASASFTRPADTTAYASGDLVANSVTAGSVAAMEFASLNVPTGNFSLRRARLRKSGTNVTNAAFRAHLYTADPTAANGDNAAFSTDGAANYLGAFDITSMIAFTDGAAGMGVPIVGPEINIALAMGQILYCLLEARGAYTPASAEVFTLTLEDQQR